MKKVIFLNALLICTLASARETNRSISELAFQNNAKDSKNIIKGIALQNFEKKKNNVFKASKGTEGVGGGDDLALEFKKTFTIAFENLNKLDVNFDLDEKKILATAEKSKVIFVDDALDLNVKDLIQNSVAFNDPKTFQILVNRERWSKISDPIIKEGIALHEILSLLNIESTGLYSVSAKYVTMQGRAAEELRQQLEINRLIQLKAQNPNATPYEILKKLYDESTLPAQLSDLEFVNETWDQDGNTNLTKKRLCVGAGKNDSNPYRLELAWTSVLTESGKPVIPAKGPLFPEIPATPDKKKDILFFFPRWVYIKDNYFNELSEELVKAEVIASTPSDLFVSFLPESGLSDWKFYFRKNGSLTSAKFQLVNDGKIYEDYAYCYDR